MMGRLEEDQGQLFYNLPGEAHEGRQGCRLRGIPSNVAITATDLNQQMIERGKAR